MKAPTGPTDLAAIGSQSDGPFILYGWHLSYYSGKVRCYLLYKQIAFIDTPVNLYTLAVSIKRRTGAVVMPVVVTPAGEWLQDSSVIIEELERRFPERPIIPTSPVPRFVAHLLEAWGDEWWVPIAMHTRWSYPENYDLFRREGGEALLPHFPRFLQNRAVATVANAMRFYLPRVGVTKEQAPLLERWTHAMLGDLDTHFASNAFLLGDAPTLADFGLIGPMYGHLGRDPWSKRELVAPRANLRAWIDRLSAPDKAAPPAGNTDDHVPATLTPIFVSIAAEFLPMVEATLAAVERRMETHATGQALPRGLDDITFPFGDGELRRVAMPFLLWKMQGVLDVYRQMQPAEQSAVRRWLETVNCARLLDLAIPRLRRVALQVAMEP